jgi:intracellular sulfur oxidation DsrE/DsrF family protein
MAWPHLEEKIMTHNIHKILFVSLVCLLSLAAYTPAASADDFAGVQSAKAVWDITTGNEKIFLDRLDLIKQTAESLQKRGIKPDFVLVIHGKAAQFVTKTLKGTKFEKLKVPGMAKAQSALKSMQDSGTPVEVCAIAMKRAKIEHANVQPFATIQDNVFENLIVLQNKGYAYMPVH